MTGATLASIFGNVLTLGTHWALAFVVIDLIRKIVK
jgi:hypothetical protein